MFGKSVDLRVYSFLLTPESPLLRVFEMALARLEAKCIKSLCQILTNTCLLPAAFHWKSSAHLPRGSTVSTSSLYDCDISDRRSQLPMLRPDAEACPSGSLRSKRTLPLAMETGNAKVRKRKASTIQEHAKKSKLVHAPTLHYTEIYLFYTC